MTLRGYAATAKKFLLEVYTTKQKTCFRIKQTLLLIFFLLAIIVTYNRRHTSEHLSFLLQALITIHLHTALKSHHLFTHSGGTGDDMGEREAQTLCNYGYNTNQNNGLKFPQELLHRSCNELCYYVRICMICLHRNVILFS